MKSPKFLRRSTIFLLIAFIALIILSTAFGQETTERFKPSFAIDQSEFSPFTLGDPSLIQLKIGSEVNRVFTPPPAGFQRSPQTATFNVNFNPASCASEEMADVIAWPEEAKAAFTYATGIWGTLINSAIPIEVDACWRPLDPGVLGSAGALNIFSDGTSLYPVALANALSGEDLDPGNSDIQANFSSEFDWYLGLDGNTPGFQLDFASVILHEVGHGLGFAGSMRAGTLGVNGPLVAQWGGGGSIPYSYDRFIKNGSNQSVIDTSIFPNTSQALYQQVTSDNLFFDGPFARAANGNSSVPVYAPSIWQPGSSYSHLAESFNGTQNALMTYSLDSGEARHNPGPVGLALLNDIGWSQTEPGEATPVPTTTPINTPVPAPTSTPIPTATPKPFIPTDFILLPLILK